ncbi:MAG: hypothetical protein ABIQ86_10775 [Steroidobacteraceae bacterium]
MNGGPVSVIYVSRGSHGHRIDYDRVLIAEMKALDIHLERIEETRYAVDTSRPFLFSMLDSHLVDFFLHALVRSARGRRTVGLFFRADTCFSKTSIKYRIKRKLFRAVSKLPHVHVLGLIPFAAWPSSAEVTTAWIYDPQMWDLLHFGFKENSTLPALRDLLAGKARGRKILVALGVQSKDKGFEYLADLWCCSAEIREKFLFVVAGNVEHESEHRIGLFVEHGGLLMNRRISNDELMSMYSCAAVVWSCYSPDYDQASGIFGRAFQMGVPVVVRNNSYLERLGGNLGHPTLPVPFGEAAVSAERLVAWKPAAPEPAQRLKLINELRAYSLKVLAGCLRPDSLA